jgi:CDP-4-dehydro-6-deoxyglucose reductase, E3
VDQEPIAALNHVYFIAVEGSGQKFQARADRTVLDEADAHGIALPNSCRAGGCGACKALVMEGTYELGPDAIALLQKDRDAGYVLLCQTYARSALRIHVEEQAQPTRTARIARVDYPEASVAVLRLEVEGGAFTYQAGQHVDLLLKDGTKRTYSIANRPDGGNAIELHIRVVDGGLFTSKLSGVKPAIRAGMRIRLSPARGDFYLRPLERPIVLVATGTGFAPIRAMLQELTRAERCPPLVLYWGARTARELYADQEAADLVSQLDGTYVPVLSEPTESNDQRLRTGFVHVAVLEDLKNFDAFDVYACGAPPMVKAAKADFSARGLPEDRFFADAFTPAAT